MSHPHDINVTVTYVAAPQPFHDHHASPSETLGSLKARVLNAFHLKEESTPDGGSIRYVFYRGKEALEDLTQTLGELAGHAHALVLKLSQIVTQGLHE